MAERVYYNREGVRITTTRAFFGRQVYAINGMTSVRMARIGPDRTGAILLMILSMFLFCPCGVLPLAASLSEEKDMIPAGLGVVMMLLGLGLAVLGVWLNMSLKPKYAVVVRTAGGEVKALVTRDAETVEQIVAALSQAFADRG